VIIAAAVVVGLAIAAFWNSFAGKFVFDDVAEIAGNRGLDTVWPVWEPMTAGNRMPARFLPYLSFAIDRRLWGVSPSGFHVTNLLVHAVASIALFRIASITLASPRLAGRFDRHAAPLAVAIAALWAVHPLQTQAVTYVYQRIESMAGMFSLVSLACFARAAATGWPRAWLVGSVAACAAAMASKENAVVLPLVILAWDWFFVADRPSDTRKRSGFYACLAATWLIVGLQLFIQRGRYQEFGDVSHPPLAYLLTQPGVILQYLRLAFWPVGQCLDYDWPLATTTREILLPGVILVAAIIITAVGTWQRKPWAWPGVAFLLLLAPTSSIMPVAAPAAEHRMYLPLAAVIGAVVVGLYTLVSRLAGAGDETEHDRPVWPWIFGGVTCLAIACLIVATHRRNELYADPEAIWQDVLAGRPQQYMAHFMLACMAGTRGDLATAESEAEQSVRSRPRSRVFAELADDQVRRGDRAAAERLLRKGIALQDELLPADDTARLTGKVLLANLLHKGGRDAEAGTLCEPLLELLDRVLGAGHATTVTARTILAYAARGRGDFDAAEKLARDNFDTAIRDLGPGNQVTQLAAASLAETLVDIGRPNEAVAMLRDLIQRGDTPSWRGKADTTAASRMLADILERSSDRLALAEAESLRRAVFEGLQRRSDPYHEQLLRAEVALGNVRGLAAEADGDFDRAEEIGTATLTAAIERCGLPDPMTQRAAVTLAATFYKTGRQDKAEQLLKEYLTDATREREAGDGTVAPPMLVRNALAGLWEQSGRLDESVALRKKILRDALDRYGPNHPTTQQAAEVLKAAISARERGLEAEQGESGSPIAAPAKPGNDP